MTPAIASINGLGNNINGILINAIVNRIIYRFSYSLCEYPKTSNKFGWFRSTYPSFNGKLSIAVRIEGDIPKLSSYAVSHFAIINRTKYPNVDNKNAIYGINSKKKSTGLTYSIALSPLSNTPKVIYATPNIIAVFILNEL